MNRDELNANVDTIVVVMMENRSFDHVLGHLRHPQYGDRHDVEGIYDLANAAYLNPNSNGVGVSPFFMPDAPLPSDLPHGPERVEQQLAWSVVRNAYSMNGFVRAFEEESHSVMREPPVMGLLRPVDLPTTSVLAERYTVCDRWFACLPTSTAPNRLMSMCGYSDHRDTGTELPNQDTVYEWLSDHGVRWRVYAAGLPFFTLMPKMAPLVLTTHFRPLASLREDIAIEGDGEWPQVIFIEPDYLDSPIHMRPPCDNHPPLPMAPGEAFLGQVYQWLSGRPERWGRTVLIVTYDEHGGFFDHVPPPGVKYRNPNGVSFDSTGPRVPAIVASPFAARGVSHLQLDNTSILQLIAERFGAEGEGYSAEVMGRRQQGIESVSAVLAADANNGEVATLPVRPLAAANAVLPPVPNTPLRQGFEAAARDLVFRHGSEAVAKYPELVHVERAK